MARAMGCGLRRRRVACSLARSSVKSSVVRPDVVKMAARSVGTSDSSMWRSAAMRTCIRSACEICTSSKKYMTTRLGTSAGLPTPNKRYPDPAQLTTYLRQVVSKVEAVPGVRDVALTSALPMQGWGYGMPFQRADKPMVDRANRQACFFKMVSPSYFRALGMKLRKGRPLGDHDGKGAPPVTVINATMVRLYFKGEDPIGKRILVQEIVPDR